MMQIYQATIDDIDLIAPLFDRYRQFYGKPTDLNAAREFLVERLKNHQSVIFIAIAKNGNGVGFTQLFPSFSSVSLARILILNDLYVDTGARRGGVAANLLGAAAQYGRLVGAIRLTLSTAMDNDRAKSLYRSKGWKHDEVFQVFELELKA